MNVKITHNHFRRLYSAKIEEFVFGSKMYGTDDDKSDTDYLVIFDPSKVFKEQQLTLPNYHQLQYDDTKNNVQYIFTTIEQFWRNLSSGDSVINSEIIIYYDRDTEYSVNCLKTFNVIKGFLGFAKRDLKQSNKKSNKIPHAARCLLIAENLMSEHSLIEPEAIKKTMVKYNKGSIDKHKEILLNKYDVLRKQCTHLFNNNKLTKYYVEPTSDDLLNLWNESNNIKEFKY